MKKIITLLSILSTILLLSKPVLAFNNKEIIYLNDGYYLETIIEEIYTGKASQQKTAKKTGNYKNSKGTIIFTVTVTGTFTYNGSTSSCTKSTVSSESKNSNWKISSKNSSKFGNKAIADATAKRYIDGKAVETQSCSVSLSCSATGNLN